MSKLFKSSNFLLYNRILYRIVEIVFIVYVFYYIFAHISLPVAPRKKINRTKFEAYKFFYKNDPHSISCKINHLKDIGALRGSYFPELISLTIRLMESHRTPKGY